MKAFKFLFFVLFLLVFSSVQAAGKSAAVSSPDGKLSLVVTESANGIAFSLERDGNPLLLPSPIGLDIEGISKPYAIRAAKVSKKTISENIESPFYRQSRFSVTYNALRVDLGNQLVLEARAFDSGVAYRFVSEARQPWIINNETAHYCFPADLTAWLPYSTNSENPFAMAFQNIYDCTPLSKAQPQPAFLPVTVAYEDDLKLTITESDLEAYPGMFVSAAPSALSLNGVFAPYPAKTDYYPWRHQEYVTEREAYIAKTAGARTFPWRIFAVTDDDMQMPVNDLVYALAAPSRVEDTSWIKGGKVAWDWWNDWGLSGVDFKAGINMETYKYYIDFASENDVEYVVLDEGWYEPKSGDIFKLNPDIRLPEMVAYARARNVGIVLWAVFNVVDAKLEEACAYYEKLGIKGLKIDFLDRDDQTAVEMTYRIAEAAARHHLFLDLHGFYKPTGLNRTYPNVINFEAVFGMEEVKWTKLENNMPLYDVTFPYIRLLAGPVDYTPGAMTNASKADWNAIYNNPMSMGTRCHQLATYVVYDSPFTMLCDAPTNYKGEEECVEYIVSVPTQVEETRILSGKMGQWIVTARRNGSEWWIGGLTNWDERDIELDLSFLPAGEYQAEIFIDGPNANKQGEDYKKLTQKVSNATRMPIHMASGGGFALLIK